MTNKELSEFIINKFNSCYTVTHVNYLNYKYLFYDESYIRKIKLYKLNNQIITPPNKIKGECLFAIDAKTNTFYCDYYSIWYIIMQNLKVCNSYDDCVNFINNTFKDTIKLNPNIPNCYIKQYITELHNNEKTIINTTHFYSRAERILNETDKLFIL